jgi:nucleoid-associated protein YgaU
VEDEWEYLSADTIQYVSPMVTAVTDSEQVQPTVPVVEEKPIVKQPTKAVSPVYSDLGFPKAIRGDARTHIVRPGERLTLIAEREYGNKAFWVYLYEENKHFLPDPDRIEIGMPIRIPAPSQYGIDPLDTGSVSKAQNLAMQLEEMLWHRSIQKFR